MIYIVCFFAFLGFVSAADHPLAEDIASGFSAWQTNKPKTALYYAEFLAARDDVSKSWAQAIIYHGAGFGGFAKRSATLDEMKQYFSTINLLKGMIPDDLSLGKSGRDDVTYHQHVMRLLAQSAAGVITAPSVRSAVYGFRKAFYWLGEYHRYVNPICGGIYNYWNSNFILFNAKSDCVYGGFFDAVPHVHPYGTADDEMTFPHHSYSHKSLDIFLVFSEPLQSWGGKEVLLRPHAYLGAHYAVAMGSEWNESVNASVSSANGESSDISGSVHIHGNVASPSGVMQLGEYENLMTRGPFVSSITSHHPAKTIHILVSPDKQGINVGMLSTNELIGYLTFVVPNPNHLDFVLKHLTAQ